MLVVLSTYLILEVLYTGFILDQETFKKVKILIKKNKAVKVLNRAGICSNLESGSEKVRKTMKMYAYVG